MNDFSEDLRELLNDVGDDGSLEGLSDETMKFLHSLVVGCFQAAAEEDDLIQASILNLSTMIHLVFQAGRQHALRGFANHSPDRFEAGNPLTVEALFAGRFTINDHGEIEPDVV